MRINRYLSARGLCSRRQADVMLQQGRVSLNGRRAVPGDQVEPGDEVLVDGKPVKAEEETPFYLLFHKPVGVVCTTSQNDPDNLTDFLKLPYRFFNVGRLDQYSSGLLMLTNDGSIVNRLLRSRYGHEKEYVVKVERPFTQAFLQAMSQGVLLDDVPTRPARCTRVGARCFRIVLTEGRNRQIRRMCEALGYRVTEIRRVRIMHMLLDGIEVGKFRKLSPDELKELFQRLDAADAALAAGTMESSLEGADSEDG